MLAVGVPAVAVQAAEERIDHDPGTADWGLWPWVEHRAMGRVRVDGLPVHLSETDCASSGRRPCSARTTTGLRRDPRLTDAEIGDLRAGGVI